MGISDGLQGSVAEVDCSAGTIVWVRRRNGSWWPGKILGSDELSASHLMSPRSGTPVKLLGREDASVDWYNLEKSKRVKAFRCGEFDDCIDKAEKSQGVPIKKREKYARREDAILHALEIERQQLEKKHKKLVNTNSASSKKARALKKELDSSSEHLENSGSKFVSLRSQPLTKGLDSVLMEENISSPSFSQRVNHGKQSNWESDKSEAVPRMRGLQDFGLRIAPKRKNPPVVCEGTRRHRPDNHVHDLPSGSRSLGIASPVTSSKDSVDIKRKRTQGGILEESLVKRRDRRRPLLKVLQSSAKLLANHTLPSGEDISPSMQEENEQGGIICRAKRSRCVYLPSDPNATECPDEMQVSPSHYERDNFQLTPGLSAEEKTTSGLMEKAESDSSRSDPDMDEEQTVLSDTILAQPMAGPDNDCNQEPTESTTDDELDEAVAVNNYISSHHSFDQTSAATDAGVSKWQLKGKRNSRNVVKRPITNSSKRSNVPMDETHLEGKGYHSNSTALGEQSKYHASEGLDYDYNEDEVIEKKSMNNQILDFGSRRYPSMLKGVSKNNHRIGNVGSGEDAVWEADGLSQAAFRGYWGESAECYDPLYSGSHIGSGKESILVDVDLKVQASYQGEHVPLVSLMSRLNGKAIIGHPIQIEVLEDGASDVFLSTNEDLSEELIDNDGSTALRPVWRTARRTNMHRVPRPHPSTTMNGDEASDPLQFLVPESKPPFNKLNAATPGQMARKSSDVCTSTGKKFPKKPARKASLNSQKTRTLSSFAMEQKLNGRGGGHKISRSGLDRLIKPENGPTTVTCIPLKLVFSRLLEAVGRPPSRQMNHIMAIDGEKERKQLPGSM